MESINYSHQISEVKQALLHHPLYEALDHEKALQKFMQAHVYCVWDFQSILKALQRKFTCLEVPWIPTPHPQARRLINEIVLEEESDEHPDGGHASHFELYIDAMKDGGVSTQVVESFLTRLKNKENILTLIETHPFPSGVASFLNFTFKTLNTASDHELVALFTLGREDLVPDLFREIVTLLANGSPQWSKFHYYLHRHIDIDSDKHAPMAFELLKMVCGQDEEKKFEAEKIAFEALNARLNLWNAILASLNSLAE